MVKSCNTCKWAGPDDCMDPKALTWREADISYEDDCPGWQDREKDRKKYEPYPDDFAE